MNTSDGPAGLTGRRPPDGLDELALVAQEIFRQLPGGVPGCL